MTTTSPLSASVLPDSMQVSSPNEYQVANLTLTVTNNSAAPYNLANGLTIVIPVDPVGSGSSRRWCCPALPVPPAGGTAHANRPDHPGRGRRHQLDGSRRDRPGHRYRTPCSNDSGMLAAGGSVVFMFSSVVADLVAGKANITVNVPPATTGLTLEAQITKLPAALSATFVAESPLLTMPDNTTELTWQVLGRSHAHSPGFRQAPRLPTTMSSTYGTWNDPPFQFNSGDPLPVATLYQADVVPAHRDWAGRGFHRDPGGCPRHPRARRPDDAAGGELHGPRRRRSGGMPVVTGVEQSGAGDPTAGSRSRSPAPGSPVRRRSLSRHRQYGGSRPFDATGSTITVAAPPVAPADITASSPGTVVDVTVTVGGDTHVAGHLRRPPGLESTPTRTRPPRSRRTSSSSWSGPASTAPFRH